MPALGGEPLEHQFRQHGVEVASTAGLATLHPAVRYDRRAQILAALLTLDPQPAPLVFPVLPVALPGIQHREGWGAEHLCHDAPLARGCTRLPVGDPVQFAGIPADGVQPVERALQPLHYLGQPRVVPAGEFTQPVVGQRIGVRLGFVSERNHAPGDNPRAWGILRHVACTMLGQQESQGLDASVPCDHSDRAVWAQPAHDRGHEPEPDDAGSHLFHWQSIVLPGVLRPKFHFFQREPLASRHFGRTLLRTHGRIWQGREGGDGEGGDGEGLRLAWHGSSVSAVQVLNSSTWTGI